MARNKLVRFSNKKGGWITITPFAPQPAPPNLAAIKAETTATWPMTSLLDMAKEADLRLGFTDALKSSTAYETLSAGISYAQGCCTACTDSERTPACNAWRVCTRE
jgi:hypothetical protein